MDGLTRRTLLSMPLLAAPVAARADAMRDVTLPISSTSFATAGLRVARELGLYERNGLNVRIVVMDSANAATSALISRSVDVVQSGPGELIAARARGQPVVTFADAYRGLSASLVLSKAAAGRAGVAPDAPAAARLKALDGLLVASPSATSAYTVSYRMAAEEAGARIRFTYMAQPAMAAALEADAVAGIIAGAPFWSGPVVRGTGILWISGPRGDLPPQNTPVSSVDLQCLESTAERDPQLIRALGQSIRDLGREIATNRDRVAAAAARLYPDLPPAQLELLLAGEMTNWDTRPFTVADMRHEIDFVRATGSPLPGLDTMDPASLLARP